MKSKLSDDLLKQMDEKTRHLLDVSGHCAQTSFAVLEEQFQLEGGRTLMKAMTPLPGIALRGETCGAVVGCLMALGLVYGREELDDTAGFMASIPPAREFCRRFEAEVGSTQCNKILQTELGQPFDLSKRSDYKEYLCCGGPSKCAGVIHKGVRIAAELILANDETVDDSGVFLTA